MLGSFRSSQFQGENVEGYIFKRIRKKTETGTEIEANFEKIRIWQ